MMAIESRSFETYFQTAQVCTIGSRQLGIEIETLYVDLSSRRPISLATSQYIMRLLSTKFGWIEFKRRRGLVVQVKKEGYLLKYEIGWNLLELISPTTLVSRRASFFDQVLAVLDEIYRAAMLAHAVPHFGYYNNTEEDTMILSSDLDELYYKVSGNAVRYLAHIAAVHYNIDLISIDEGFKFAKKLNRYFRKKDWPPRSVRANWSRYISTSEAGYEPTRFGPSPETFVDYLQKASMHRKFFTFGGCGWRLSYPYEANRFDSEQEIDIFLSLLWWWSRLRVRSGRLTLEIRAIPRSDDNALGANFLELSELLGC